MICPKCGIPNHEEARFCAACGTQMIAPPMPPEAVAVQEACAVPMASVDAETTILSEDPSSAHEPQAAELPAQHRPPAPAPHPPTQPPYGPPPYWQPPQMPHEEPISLLKWLGMMALESVCWIAHVVLMFVWGFSSKSSQTLKNYARAKLIMVAVTIILSLVFVIVWFSMVIGMVEAVNGYPY